MRKLLGVTSTSSSCPRYSRANSKDISCGGVKIKASSDPEARMFVRCFSLHTFTSRSSSRLFSPTTMPLYTSTPGPMNMTPRSCVMKSA